MGLKGTMVRIMLWMRKWLLRSSQYFWYDRGECLDNESHAQKNVLQACKMKQGWHTTYEAQGLFHAKALNHTSRICLVKTKKKGRATNWTTAGHLTQTQSSCGVDHDLWRGQHKNPAPWGQCKLVKLNKVPALWRCRYYNHQHPSQN